jgi:hypothetical protein
LKVWAWPYSILHDYFVKHLIYGEQLFWHWYQMRHPLFLRIVENICAHDPYFIQKRDACDVLGLSLVQKCTSVLHMLAYSKVVDACDEYCRIGKNTSHECL